MPFDNCIAAAEADQQIGSKRAARYREDYAQRLADYQTRMGPQEAAAAAARDTFAVIEGEAGEARRRLFLQLAVRKDIDARLAEAADPFKAATGLLDRLRRRGGRLSAEGQREYWRTRAHAMLSDAMHKFRRSGFLGIRRGRALLNDVIDELHGTATSNDVARGIAKAWLDSANMLRSARNRFGGHTEALEDWGSPTFHNARKIFRMGREKWTDFTIKLLARDRMLDYANGQPLSDGALRALLGDIWLTITTNDWTDRLPSAVVGHQRSLAGMRSQHRVLHFSSGENWRIYQREAGRGNVWEGMLGHIDAMSAEVGLMQVLGPSPAASLAYAKSAITRRANLLPTPDPSKAVRVNDQLQKMFDIYTGKYNQPARVKLAGVIEDAGNAIAGAQLGGAVIAAGPSDMNTARLTRSFNGIPQVRMLSTYLKQLNPASSAHRKIAMRLGLGAQTYAQVLGREARYLQDLAGHTWSRWLLSRTVTWSGLTAHTAAIRAAHGVDTLGFLADRTTRSFDKLGPRLREGLARYGIGADEWETIRSTKLHDEQGATFLRPEDVANRADLEPGHALDLSSKLADFVLTETEFAVPSMSLAGRTVLTQPSHPGTLPHFFGTSLGMYKNFGTTMYMSHGRRLAERMNVTKRAEYTASLLILATIAGAVTVQMKQLAAGREVRDMDDPKFWLAAMAQGGGLGIFGDFVYAGVSGSVRSGQGLGETILGPIVGFGVDLAKLSTGTSMEAYEKGEPQRFTSGLIDFAKRNMPAGNVWWARAALERYVWDALQEETDPGWKSRVGRIERFYRSEYDQDYWWPRSAPEEVRAPDLDAMFGGSSQ